MKLMICGNGFDLHHGLKTSYTDYRCFICKNHTMVLNDYEEYCKTFNKSDGSFWSDIEQSLTIDKFSFSAFLKNYDSDDAEKEAASIELYNDLAELLEFINPFTGYVFLIGFLE